MTPILFFETPGSLRVYTCVCNARGVAIEKKCAWSRGG